jgi:uncharacterized protein YndB with AHSA1/START domain/DNA-binding transcriptional ArsR family regulator
MEELEPVFRALADPHRRHLLDRLRERDGLALGELEAGLPQMTRFGVMKHLRILERAGIVATRRDGRRKLHFLNPVPIQLIADRWISRYAAPLVRGMADVKHSLEAASMGAPRHVYEIYIRATPERVWQAITDPALTEQYYYGTRVESDWAPGSRYVYTAADGSEQLVGELLEVDPPRRLVTTFSAVWDDGVRADPPSKLTWEIVPFGPSTLLRMTHDDVVPGSATEQSVTGGWSVILSGLKTVLETGEPMRVEYPSETPVGA